MGEPSTVSRETFVRVDQLAVLDFAIACRQAGVRHFQLLSSIGVDAHSHNFFLRKKGELNDALVALGFERLSLFQPSMILTPTNRYGFSQAVTLAVWPRLHGLMRGRLEKARGVPVDVLGEAMACNLWTEGRGVERLTWRNFMTLTGREPR